jgi:hypothetical protein
MRCFFNLGSTQEQAPADHKDRDEKVGNDANRWSIMVGIL